ncbi:unnamed protein product [Trichogramma brassicae]|uniref:Uncharacterized protein n=1 Tax=Trichogramma brassicae TaxID=86971 RepID=A0A6H5IQQ0_9HYME|nr:unnamed protein product [Trichogramma brassicae]
MHQRAGSRTRGTRGHLSRVATRLQRQAEDPRAPPAPPPPPPAPRFSAYCRSVLAAAAGDDRQADLEARDAWPADRTGAATTSSAAATTDADTSAVLPPPIPTEDLAPPAEDDAERPGPTRQDRRDDEDVLVLCASSDSDDENEARGGAGEKGFQFPPVAEIEASWSDEDWDEGVDLGAFPGPASRWPRPRFPAIHNLGLTSSQRRRIRREKLAAAIKRQEELGEALNRGEMAAPASPPNQNPERFQRLLEAKERADVVRAKRVATQVAAPVLTRTATSADALGPPPPTTTEAPGNASVDADRHRQESARTDEEARQRDRQEEDRRQQERAQAAEEARRRSRMAEDRHRRERAQAAEEARQRKRLEQERHERAVAAARRVAKQQEKYWEMRRDAAMRGATAKEPKPARPSTSQAPKVITTRRADNEEEPWWEREYQASLLETEPKRRGAVFDGRHLPRDTRVEPPKGGCFICWETTHGWRACQRVPEFVYCWNCGRRDSQAHRDRPTTRASHGREASVRRSPSRVTILRAPSPPRSTATITEIVEPPTASAVGPSAPPAPTSQAPPRKEELALITRAAASPTNAVVPQVVRTVAPPGPGTMEFVLAMNQLAESLRDVRREVREEVLLAAVRSSKRPHEGKLEGHTSKRRAVENPRLTESPNEWCCVEPFLCPRSRVRRRS